jgi:hypothetical protein
MAKKSDSPMKEPTSRSDKHRLSLTFLKRASLIENKRPPTNQQAAAPGALNGYAERATSPRADVASPRHIPLPMSPLGSPEPQSYVTGQAAAAQQFANPAYPGQPTYAQSYAPVSRPHAGSNASDRPGTRQSTESAEHSVRSRVGSVKKRLSMLGSVGKKPSKASMLGGKGVVESLKEE